MEIRQIQYFLAVAATLNFTEAARRCNVTQPALSRGILNLESELGGPLFYREGRRTQLSELGRLMFPYLSSVAADTEKAHAAADQFLRGDHSRLRLGVMCTVGPALIADFLSRLLSDHPGLEVDARDANFADTLAGLLEGRHEAAIVSTPMKLDNRLNAIGLFTDRFGVAVPSGHRFAALDFVSCAALDDERYINRADCEYFQPISAVFASIGVGMRTVFSSPRDEWVTEMIRAGLGIGIFAERAFKPQNGIEFRPIVDPSFDRDVVLATVRGRPHSPAVGALIRAARRFDWTGGRSAEHLAPEPSAT